MAILYKTMPHYRVEFFERLRNRLDEDGVDLVLVVGQPDNDAATKHDTAELEWATGVRNRYIKVGNRRLVWQPVLRLAGASDLVIVEQASRLLVNPILAAWSKVGGPRFALWGHGRNLDAGNASRLGEWWKRTTIRSCHWWFAYTEGTARFIRATGFPEDRITVVQNAIDTAALALERAQISATETEQTKSTLGIASDHVAMFVGSLYEAKRLPFLIESADLIRDRISDFELLIVGDGPDRAVVDEAARTRPWIHVLGALRGRDLTRHASLSSVVLMPGPVGLAVLDAFAFCTPMITTAVPNHGPEIEYLADGDNGVIVGDPNSAEAFSDAVITYFLDRALQARLIEGCRDAAQRYTVNEMVERFRGGVLGALRR